MNANDKLAELIIQAMDTYATMPLVNGCRPELKYFIAGYLLANGVVVVDTNIVSPKNRPLISQCMGRPLDEIIELVHAKDEGRILVLPCKVGDTMYFDGGHFAKHRAGEIMERRVDAVLTEVWSTFRGDVDISFDFKDFGKTVFLTRELAEKALAERSKNGNL